MNHEQERQQLRAEVQHLRERLSDVERRLDALAAADMPPAVTPPEPPTEASASSDVPPVIASVSSPPAPPSPIPEKAVERESFEVRLGTYWLPRLGMVALLIGMVFLVTWSYQYLGRGGKVALSYLCCAALGALGIWLERKTEAFARVLQAGALALTYFVTYAAHFVDTFRIIDSTAIGLGLLVVVVAAIVIVADRKRSPTIAGLALFLGYFTSVMSGVTTFTLAANAVLAVAALVFLARNQWVPISYGAVFATYLAYMLWVWGLSRWGELGRLIFEADYLSAADFRLRGGFLTLYWVLFTAGSLLVRDATERATGFSAAERNGLLTLNNLFYFLLASLLVHHAFSDWQWQFQFVFGGALLVISAIAYTRLQPDRTAMDLLFTQGVVVGSLGVINCFEGTTLVAVLAVESVLLLFLARSMSSRAVAWVGRVIFAIAAWEALANRADWDRALILSGAFAAIMGYFAARLERQPRRDAEANQQLSFPSLYFALMATALLLRTGRETWGSGQLPWIWSMGSVVVTVFGVVLRTREIRWAGLFPLIIGLTGFLGSAVIDREWALAPSLGLVAVLFAYGLLWWAHELAQRPEAEARVAANRVLRPFAIAAVVVVVLTTIEHGARDWLLTIFAVESLVFVAAGLVLGESLFIGLAMATMASGGIGFTGPLAPASNVAAVAWTNLLAGLLVMTAAERLFKVGAPRLLFYERTRAGLRAWMVVIVGATAIFGLGDLVAGRLLTLSWALAGFGLMAIGFLGRERAYRLAGLAALGCCLLRAMIYDLGQLEVPYRILSFIALGVILLVLGFLYARYRERLSKWL